MDDYRSAMREKLLHEISKKSRLDLLVFDNTFDVLTSLKEVLQEMSAEFDDELEELDKRTKIEYRDRGKFEAQLQIGGEMLIFSMHTNVFGFDRHNAIWQNPYVSADRDNAYCGIINIYNFLSDTFKYNRNADEGYLIGRIFVNRENCYFVEGGSRMKHGHDTFGAAKIDRGTIIDIVERAVGYSMEFELHVPPYETVKTVSADQMNTKIENSKTQTGKRLGYVWTVED